MHGLWHILNVLHCRTEKRNRDMGFALLGALVGVVLLSTQHNRQMNQHKL
jgi:hypothetical protein